MSALLQMSADGKRFHGRWTESLGHCITQSEFGAELRRINCETARHMQRRSAAANLAYALPFVCIPFGILLIVLSLQQEKWPFVLAGVVLGTAGAIGGALFRSALGLVLIMCGAVLAIVPYADKTSWACIAIGTILAIIGSVGLMAMALRNRRGLRSARILVVLLPVAVVFFCVPLQNLEYPAVMICIGVVLIAAGVLGAIETALRPSRQLARCVDDLRVVIDQLNQRYANRLIWTLIERPVESSRSSGSRTLEIVVEVDENSPYNQRMTDNNTPVVNVVVQQPGRNNPPQPGTPRPDVNVPIPPQN